MARGTASALALASLTATTSFAFTRTKTTPAAIHRGQRGIYSPSKRNDTNVAICVCVRNETRYMDEWVDFHVALGFSPIVVYDNAATPDRGDLELESWYERRTDVQHHVRIIHLHVAPVQGVAFERCLHRDAANSTFVAPLDVDEFVVLRKHDNIIDFMTDHCDEDCGQISLNWKTMGTSNESRYRPLPITKRNVHVHTYAPLESIVKVIVRPSYVDRDDIDWSHSFKLKRGNWVDTDGIIVPRVHSTTRGVRPPYQWDGPSNVAALYHYRFKSEEEFRVKSCVRGEAIRRRGETPKCDHIGRRQNYPRDGGTFDDSAWRQLMRMVPKYRVYDERANATLY